MNRIDMPTRTPDALPARNGDPQQSADKPAPPRKILAIDIGGSKVKMLVSGETEPRKITSGRRLTPAKMIERIHTATDDWEYEAIVIGFPGLVGENGPRSEPGNLSAGWVGFDFAAAFGMPVRILNDAAMQALGSYEGGRMLFLGLGTGLGSALISQNVIVSLELGQLRTATNESYGELLGRKGLGRIGKRKWRVAVAEAVNVFAGAFVVDYVVLGGGNAKELKVLPPVARMGHNLTAFRGGFRLWNLDDVKTHHPDGTHEIPTVAAPVEWRMLN